MPRGLVLLLGAAAAVIAVGGIGATAWLVGPVFLALVLVIAAHPLARWLQRHGAPTWAATLGVAIAVYLGALAFALVLTVSLGQLTAVLPQYSAQFEALVASVEQALAGLGVGPAQVQAATESFSIGSVLGFLGGLLSSVTAVLSNIVLILALLLFFIADASGFGGRLEVIAADRPHVVRALEGFAHGTRRYLVVTTVFGLVVAVLDGIALATLGVPLAVLWGVLAFITNYIPNVGFVFGLVPPALLALLAGGPRLMVIVIVVYIVLNFVIQSLIQPRFVGDSVGLSASVTFVTLLFWTWVLGPLGAVLAIPLTLLAKALLVDIDPSARWADALLRSQGAERPAATRADEDGVPERRRALSRSTGRPARLSAPSGRMPRILGADGDRVPFLCRPRSRAREGHHASGESITVVAGAVADGLLDEGTRDAEHGPVGTDVAGARRPCRRENAGTSPTRPWPSSWTVIAAPRPGRCP
jgi:AI-2 transport protein TqsA